MMTNTWCEPFHLSALGNQINYTEFYAEFLKYNINEISSCQLVSRKTNNDKI